MSKPVKGPDGVVHNFPDAVDEATINSEMANLYKDYKPGTPAVPALRGPTDAPPDQPATPAAPDPLAPTDAPPAAARDYSRMRVLSPGQRITNKGIEMEEVGPEGKRLTAAQRAALDKMDDFNPDAPAGTPQNPLIATGSPRGPVGSFRIMEDGTVIQQKPHYDDSLGFDQEVTRATNNVYSALGLGGTSREDRENQMLRAHLAGTEPGAVGGVAGGIIGTYPYVFATRNPYIGGAIAGGVNTKEDDIEGVAKDATIGAAAGRLIDMGGNFIGTTIAPRLKEGVNRLLNAGVKLTPGQMAGGPAQRIEDAATSIPIAGDMISAAQKRSQESFNTAAINEAVEPGGVRLDKVGPDELIERRAPQKGDLKPKPGGTRPEDVQTGPLAITDQPLVLGGKEAPRIGGPKSIPDLRGRETNDNLPAKAGQSVGSAVSTVLSKVGINLPAKMRAATPGSPVSSIHDVNANGQPINKGTESPAQFGHEAVEWAHQQLRIKYNNLLQGTTSTLTELDPAVMKDISEAASQLTPDNLAAFQKFVETNVRPRFFRGKDGNFGGTIRGDEWKELDSMLGNEVREFGRSLDPNQRKLGQVYRDMQVELREMFAKGVEKGRAAASLPTARNPGNQAVDAVNETVIAKHTQDVKNWEKMFEGVPMAKRPPMPKLEDAGKMQKALPDLDGGFTRGKGGEAVPGNQPFADELRGIDKAYSNLLRIESAAGKAANGVFTASGLKTAVRELDSSLRRRATAHGKAAMQQTAEDALNTLNKKVPDSGTATRGVINAAAAMALLGNMPKIAPNPMLMASLGAMLAPYTKAGGAAVRTIMGRRPAGANRLREVTDAVTDFGSGAAAGPVVALRGRKKEED